MSPTERLQQRITHASRALHEAEKPLRILGLLAWPLDVRNDFLSTGGRHLPQVDYPDVDNQAVDDALRLAQPLIADAGPAREWLERTAERIATASRMVRRIGTPGFSSTPRRCTAHRRWLPPIPATARWSWQNACAGSSIE